MRAVMRSWAGRVGLVLTALVVVMAVAAPLLAPHDPYRQAVVRRLKPPVWMEGGVEGHLLGTDQLGRDNLSRLIYGARISLFVGAVTVVVAGAVGTALGVLAGYHGGRVDYVISTLINAAWSFPFILLALIIVAVLGAGLQNLVVALVATSWASFARIARGEVMAVKGREFVAAAEALGLRTWRTLLRHVLPNVTSSLLVVATIEFGRAILRESFLSFLGLGVPPSIPSWGGMLSEARPYVFTMWWLVFMPGASIFVTTLGVNLLGDGLRDAFDPRTRGR